MVVGQSFKQYFKQEISLDLASCALRLSKSTWMLPDPAFPLPKNISWIQDGGSF